MAKKKNIKIVSPITTIYRNILHTQTKDQLVDLLMTVKRNLQSLVEDIDFDDNDSNVYVDQETLCMVCDLLEVNVSKTISNYRMVVELRQFELPRSIDKDDICEAIDINVSLHGEPIEIYNVEEEQ